MAVPDLYYKLGGVDLQAHGVQVKGTSFRPPIIPRRSPVEIPGVHGHMPSGRLPTFGTPKIILRMWHQGTTASEINAAADVVASALAQPILTVTRSLLVGGSRVEHTAVAELVSVDWGDFEAQAMAEAVIVLELPGVFFRDGNLTPWTNAWGTGTLTAAPIPHLAASTGPIPDAIVRVLGPVTNPSITDVVSGTSLTWSGTVAAGEYLYLDARLLKARTSTSSTAWTTGGTDVTSTLDYGTAGPLQLWPRPTAANPAVREVLITATGSGRTTATEIAVRAEGSFL